MESKPIIWKAVLTALLEFVVFFLSFFIVSTIILFVISLISPISDIIFFYRGDTPLMASSCISTIVSYNLVCFISNKINGYDTKTDGLNFILVGSFVLLYQIWVLFINFYSENSVFINLVLIITGICFVFKGINKIKE